VLQDRRSNFTEGRTLLSSADTGFQTDPAGTRPNGAPRIGAELRAARERIGADLPEVARALRIRQVYLEAIEEGRIADLPGNAYAVGFLRTYATALGLDPAEVVRRFRAEAAEVNQKTELTFPAPVPERGVPAGAVVLVGLVLAIGGYAGWYRLSGEGKLPAEVVAPVPERLKPLVQQAVPPSTADKPPAVASATPPAPQPAPDAAAAADAAPPPMIASVPPTAAAAATPPAALAPAALQPPPPVAAAAAQLVVRAKADSWIQVRDPKTGQVLVNKILHPGDSWTAPADSAGLLLTTGNAGGTELVVDGTVAPPLGGPGVVRRDMPLDPAVIRDGKLPAQQAASAAAPAGATVAAPAGAPVAAAPVAAAGAPATATTRPSGQ
jgi:cytoskeleton protein RodZ